MDRSKSTSDAWKEWIPERRVLRRAFLALGLAIPTILLVRLFLLAPVAIPTSSMSPTVLEGDVLLINKLPGITRSTGSSAEQASLGSSIIESIAGLQRGDVILFRPPYTSGRRGSEPFLKRVIGLPGDTVVVRSFRLRRFGSAEMDLGGRGATEVQLTPPMPINPTFRGPAPAIVPYRGMEIALDAASILRWRDLLILEGYRPTYRNGIVFLNGRPATRHTVSRNYLAVAGDNWRESYDSRYFGFVPVDDVIGKGVMIYWSREDSGIRWPRIGRGFERD